MEEKTMTTSKKIIIVSLVLFVSAMPVLAQDIHEAAKAGDLEQLKKILGKNPSLVNSLDKDRMTPLRHAIDGRYLEAASLLISHGADVNAVNYKTETPLHIAAYKGNTDAGSAVNDKSSRGEIVLVSTLDYGKKEIIDLLIDRGATIPDDEGTLRRVLYVTASICIIC
jgi:ankyrin repeat protein